MNYKGSELVVQNMTHDDAGTYKCVANNSIKPNDYKEMLVSVACKYSFDVLKIDLFICRFHFVANTSYMSMHTPTHTRKVQYSTNLKV